MPQHRDHWKQLTIISFDKISVMAYKKSGNQYHEDDNENINETFTH